VFTPHSILHFVKMAGKTAEESFEMDDLSRLQKKLDDLGVMFYTYIGILQRDAPPIARAPDETSDLPSDNTKREELAKKAPEYARYIVQCSREIDEEIAEIDGKMKEQDGKERNLLDNANFESMQAGEEMTEAVDDAQKLLSSVRDIITAREGES